MEDYFILTESMPFYEGGAEAFSTFLNSELKYPDEAKREGIEGRVYVQFIVEKDGSLSDIKAIKGVGGGCENEAERVMGFVPGFKPGLERGVPVRTQMVLSIEFKSS